MPISVSVSELARNAAAYADRLRRRERFVLVHDGEPVAELRPVPPRSASATCPKCSGASRP